MEKIFYLDGLYRSGNTVLSSIINQNPKIHSTELNPIPEFIFELDKISFFSENSRRNYFSDSIKEMMLGIHHSYYKTIKKPYLMSRSRHWLHPNNFNLIKKYLDSSPKIIYTVRPTLDILSSMTLLLRKDPYIDKIMFDIGFPQLQYLPIEDARCDFIMDSSGLLASSFVGLNNGLLEENKNFVHFVHYDDLLNYPETTMKNIYNFLEIDFFNHDFNNIKKIEKDNDEINNNPKNLHDVRLNLKKTSPDYKEVLSDYVINKYKDADFWKNKINRIGE
jgi:hypothetical protein